jgi:cysteine desulfurase
LDVQSNGLINLEDLKNAFKAETLIVSIMAVSNEIGVIQPLKEIGSLCREHGIFFHTDAAQAAGKIPLDVDAMNIDLMSISGHKLYGPKGIGALYVRRKPRVRLAAQISGGGQERGMRSGTLPVFLCVGLGEACELSEKEMAADYAHIKKLSDQLYNKLKAALPKIYLNGDELHRYPGNLNISFAHVEGEGLMMGIKNLSVSSGSACTSASLEPSYVLKALGVDEELAHTSLRIGIGRFTTEEEINQAADDIIKAVNHLRSMSPLWEMAEAGIDLKSIQWAEH